MKTIRFPWTLLMMIAILASMLPLTACTVLDGGDRDDLEEAIDEAPPIDRLSMSVMAINAKARTHLDGLNHNTRVFKMECTHRVGDGWSEPREEIDIYATVADVIGCMDKGHTYGVCLNTLIKAMRKVAVDRWKERIAAAPEVLGDITETECDERIDKGFRTIDVPGGEDDLNRVTATEIVDWLLGLPAPPHGLSLQAWRALGPLLCALDVAWGCAPGLGGGGIITPAPSGGGTGDYP
jgi:hypothetical protein